MALLKKELRSNSLLREHHFSISGTPIALRDKQQYLYCAIVLNMADFGGKEMKVKKSSDYALQVLMYKVRHSTQFLTTSSAIGKTKGISSDQK